MPGTTETRFDRDEMARWYAGRHMNLDEGVVRILYLPEDAGLREIRFLEVNTLISEVADPEPIDFGVGIDGSDAHTLFVLDVTPSQWDAIRAGSLALPAGWTLENSQELGQR